MKESSITIRAYNNPETAGNVNFVAVVSPVEITGDVYWFVDQAYVTSNRPVNGLVPSSTLSITPAGSHLITCVYGGDTNYLPSSAVIIQTAD